MKTTMDSDMSESCDRKAFFSEAMRTAAGVVLAGGVLVPERAAAAAVKKGEEEAVSPLLCVHLFFGSLVSPLVKPVLYA